MDIAWIPGGRKYGECCPDAQVRALSGPCFSVVWEYIRSSFGAAKGSEYLASFAPG